MGASGDPRKVPIAAEFANRICAIFAIFILPVLALRIAADCSCCPTDMPIIVPRFQSVLDDNLASSSGICLYEISCVAILVSRSMFMGIFGPRIFQYLTSQDAGCAPPLPPFFPKVAVIYIFGSFVLFVVLFTKASFGNSRETIHFTFLVLSLGGSFSFFTPGALTYWLLAIRARLSPRKLDPVRGEHDV